MKILVTGANGYLGNVLLNKLAPQLHTITSIDLGIFKSNKVDYLKLDLSTAKFSEIIRTNYDAIIHLASVSNDPSAELDPTLTHRMNIEASKRLIDFASATGVRRFIFASSASVYGSNSELVNEQSPTNPLTAYAKSKKEIEDYLVDFRDLHPIIFRFGTLFGVSPKMRFDIAINLMVKDALLTNEVNVYGGGEQFRPFLHVYDAATIISKALNWNLDFWGVTDIFNYAVSNIKIKTLAEIISGLTGAKLIIHPVDSPDLRNYKMSSYLVNKNLIVPEKSIFDGIKEVFNWCNSNKDDLNNIDYYTIKAWKEYIKGENTIFKT